MSQAPPLPVERFTALASLPGIGHGFTTRVPGIEVTYDKVAALERLDRVHRDVRDAIGVGAMPFATAEQVHSNDVALVDDMRTDTCAARADALVTAQKNICLGIYVADCCAIFFVDPVRSAIGLVHSGRKGTELCIVQNAIDRMSECFGSAARDLVVQLSPCIRPPHYEIDFAAEIAAQCRERGVVQINDEGTCTACDLARYYSYRAEKGRTGRMLALLALLP